MKEMVKLLLSENYAQLKKEIKLLEVEYKHKINEDSNNDEKNISKSAITIDNLDKTLEYIQSNKLKYRILNLLRLGGEKSMRILKTIIKEKNYKIKYEYILNIYDTFDISALYKKEKEYLFKEENMEFKNQILDGNKLKRIFYKINNPEKIVDGDNESEIEEYKITFRNNFIFILNRLETRQLLNAEHKKFIVFILSFLKNNSLVKAKDRKKEIKYLVYLIRKKKYAGDNLFIFMQYDYFYYFINFIIYFYAKEYANYNEFNEIIADTDKKWLEWRENGYPQDKTIICDDKDYQQFCSSGILKKTRNNFKNFFKNNSKNENKDDEEAKKWYEERSKLFK
ncbi:hypothetical protein SLOPH_914 [Spraguea lophii 42_110]|uniref:Uncharacterized protein n=1 Tax=Spraguea lophii (strain 42_110) TaxID=1358809 RepID=S7XVX6_SPRLO|nr:hypothetical protein SLOPH_914 [Spraguea lophii 42_110]